VLYIHVGSNRGAGGAREMASVGDLTTELVAVELLSSLAILKVDADNTGKGPAHCDSFGEKFLQHQKTRKTLK